MQPLKNQMNHWFVEKAPFHIPPQGKETLIKAMPWISLVVGILSLWSAWSLYRFMTIAYQFTDYTNALNRAYGGPAVDANIGFFGWLSLGLLVAEGIAMLIAFPALKERKKSGWDMLYWVALVNVAYAVVSLFRDAGGLGTFLLALVGSVIGFYLLFQIRSTYDHTAPKKPAVPKPPAPATKV